jgi:hypothetical protein
LKELLWLFPQEAISGGFYKEVRWRQVLARM